MKTFLTLVFIFASIAGFTDASYITYNELNGIIPPCNVHGFACETVLQSKWAHIGPLPLSVLGLIFYGTVFLFAVLHLTEVDLRPAARSLVQRFVKKPEAVKSHPFSQFTAFDGLSFAAGIGFLFSIYLLTLMAFIIQAWCLYCLISALTSATLFILTRIYARYYADHTPIFTHFFTSSVVGFVYQHMVKPICFRLDAELVHNTIVKVGAGLGSLGITRWLTQVVLAFRHPSLTKKIDGITFPNPIGLAAGFDYNADLTQTLSNVGFGWHTVGTVTRWPYEGNTPPRLGRYPRSKALLVNKGFKSPGAQAVIKRLAGLRFAIPVGISIGSTNREFANMQEQLLDILVSFWQFENANVRHSYYEMNISCPNTLGGQPFTTPDRLEILLSALDHLALSRPVYLKMPIHLGDSATLALLKVADAHQIAGVIFGNLHKDKSQADMDKEELAHWQGATGYVSGKPTFELSNHLIALTRQTFHKRFTIIGTGGVFTPEDAAHKLALGADLVQLITGMVFQGPQVIGQMNNYLARQRA